LGITEFAHIDCQAFVCIHAVIEPIAEVHDEVDCILHFTLAFAYEEKRI